MKVAWPKIKTADVKLPMDPHDHSPSPRAMMLGRQQIYYFELNSIVRE
jgi:hypothetical protein